MTDKTVAPTLDDFDNWGEEDDAKAYAAIAGNFRVKHVIKGDTWWALTPAGNIYRLPLALSYKSFQKLSELEDVGDQLDTVTDLLETFAGKDQAARIETEPVQVVINLVTDYGAAIADAQGASVGKSADSPAS
ncbi:hypothetical protein [Bifidobacterium cuniculi]|uniref:ATP-dependent serine Clp protease n=1 Tax=Bifidobacterium cuniculi TaxID=1688 RepID=A0A087B4E2_9BIFI|nr:hypothetical protein [Bifidobacterium cuniculi]KFI65892.1 ATP-dependent serine Clp protease [Bifidobacterium cuniculi]